MQASNWWVRASETRQLCMLVGNGSKTWNYKLFVTSLLKVGLKPDLFEPSVWCTLNVVVDFSSLQCFTVTQLHHTSFEVLGEWHQIIW